MDGFERFENDFRAIAFLLTRDTDLRNDLIQEMRVCVWRMEEGRSDSFYLQGAKFGAIDFLRKFYPNKISIYDPDVLEGYK